MAPPSNVHKLVDDLFGRPPRAAAAETVATASSSEAVERAAPLVDALFGSSDKTVVSTNSLRDTVLGALTHHGGAAGAAASASASPARPPPPPSEEAPGTDFSQHLLFLVHGIGEHQDFLDDKIVSWDGSEGGVGGNHEFRQLLAAVASRRLGAAPLSLTVASVEWHSALRATASDDGAAAVSDDAAADALLGACSPTGVTALRAFTRSNVMDVLYYTSVPHAQLIVDTVLEQMSKRWASFLVERPGWDGSVHLLGHSLGSLIVLDIITHAGTSWHGVCYPELPFPVTHVFVCGSPAPLFLVARRQVVAVGSAEAAAAAPPARLPCAGFFNFVNASDPIAHFYNPFLIYTSDGSDDGGTRPGCGEGARLAIRSAATLKSLVEAQRSPPPPHELPAASKTVPTGSPVEVVVAAVREAETKRAAIDHHIISKAAWTSVGAALNVPAAHASYWYSEEICLFILLQMLVPWAQAQHAQHAAEAGPATPPRRRRSVHGTPTRLAASAPATPGAASPRMPGCGRPSDPSGAAEADGGCSASPAANGSCPASPRAAPPPGDVGGVPPLDTSVPAQAAGLVERRCDVTGLWSRALLVLQRGALYVIPAQKSEIPRLVGSIQLSGSVATMPSAQSKKAGYFTLHAPHANAAGPRTYDLYSPDGSAGATSWVGAINGVCEDHGGRECRKALESELSSHASSAAAPPTSAARLTTKPGTAADAVPGEVRPTVTHGHEGGPAREEAGAGEQGDGEAEAVTEPGEGPAEAPAQTPEGQGDVRASDGAAGQGHAPLAPEAEAVEMLLAFPPDASSDSDEEPEPAAAGGDGALSSRSDAELHIAPAEAADADGTSSGEAGATPPGEVADVDATPSGEADATPSGDAASGEATPSGEAEATPSGDADALPSEGKGEDATLSQEAETPPSLDADATPSEGKGGDSTLSQEAEAPPSLDADATPSEGKGGDSTLSQEAEAPPSLDADATPSEEVAGADATPSGKAAGAGCPGAAELPASAPAAASAGAASAGVTADRAPSAAGTAPSGSVSLRDDFLKELRAEAASSSSARAGLDAAAGPPRSGAELRGLFGARKAGALKKRGQSSLTLWKNRWFALHGQTMLYFSREPQFGRPILAASVSRSSFRIHRPKPGDPPEKVAITVSWALGGGRAVFLRLPPEGLKQWEAVCDALHLPVERNFAV